MLVCVLSQEGTPSQARVPLRDAAHVSAVKTNVVTSVRSHHASWSASRPTQGWMITALTLEGTSKEGGASSPVGVPAPPDSWKYL